MTNSLSRSFAGVQNENTVALDVIYGQPVTAYKGNMPVLKNGGYCFPLSNQTAPAEIVKKLGTTGIMTPMGTR